MERYLSGTAAGLLSLLAPVRPLVLCALIFVAIDFVTGVMASRKRARKRGEPWGFESEKAWNTVAKLFFVMAGILLAWLIDAWILPHMNLRMANIFTGFVCGVEFWSYLENAAEISEHPAFRALKKLMKNSYDKRLKEQ
jgi:phage-related holin